VVAALAAVRSGATRGEESCAVVDWRVSQCRAGVVIASESMPTRGEG